MNVTDAFWRNSFRWPERTALVQSGRPITFSGLRSTIEKLIVRLYTIGVQPGTCVAISCDDQAANLSLAMALARAQVITTPLNVAWPADVRQRLILRNKVTIFLCDERDVSAETAEESVRRVAISSLFAGLESEANRVGSGIESSGDQIWRIAISSGTTGLPKSIGLTHKASCLRYALHTGTKVGTDQDPLMIFADIGMAMCLERGLMQLSAGGTLIFPGNASPKEFLSVLLRDQPGSVLSTPAIALNIVGYLRKEAVTRNLIPVSFKKVSLGGSFVPPDLRVALHEHLGCDVEVTYGSTETGSLAVAEPRLLADEPSCAGRLWQWVQAQALDTEGRVLPPGQKGILRFRSAAMATQYLDDPLATAKAFRDGWYYPGDTGYVDERGYLYLGGRSDDLLNIQGVKIDPVAIEQVLERFSSVQEAGVVAIRISSSELRLVAAIVAPDSIDLNDLFQYCRRHFDDASSPRRFFVVRVLPRTVMGKLDRAALQAQVLEKLQRQFEDTNPAPLADD
jgi:acyl-coenzyme A synthetase/AMP-(fatty) acid ligase